MAQFYTVSIMYLGSYSGTVVYGKYHVHLRHCFSGLVAWNTVGVIS